MNAVTSGEEEKSELGKRRRMKELGRKKGRGEPRPYEENESGENPEGFRFAESARQVAL